MYLDNNAEWRNFIIPVDKTRHLSLGQWWDENRREVADSEVALLENGQIVGEPVRFKYADGFADILKQVIEGDYTLFTRQYLVELELPFGNDNQSA